MTVRAASRAATFALLAAVVSVATPARLRAQDLGCDPGDQEVRALEFRGNRAVRDDDLALRVRTTPSAWGRRRLHLWFAEKRCLNRDELPRDLLRLKAYYRDRGFYLAEVDTVVQTLGKEAVRVIFNIDEGPPTRLVSYTVTGLERIRDSAEIVNRRRLRVGRPFDLGLLVADMDTIKYRLRDAGYYRADVFHAYDRQDDTAVVSITVVPGERARFGEPVFQITPVEGRPQQLATPVVKRVLRISPGEWYSDRAIIEAQRNLFQLGTYRHIDVAPLPDSLQPPGDTIVILEVRLTEDYMRQLDSEVGWATLDCGRLRFQYTDKNLFGSARRFDLTAQASKIGYGQPLATSTTRRMCTLDGRSPLASDSSFSSKLYYFTGISVRQPRLLGTRWVPALSVYSERRGEFKAYLRSTQVGGDFSATRDIGDRVPLRLAYTFEYGQTRADPPALCALFNRCDTESRRHIQELLPLGVASATLARVRTDNLISPTRGLAMRGELRSSASRLLGTSDSLFFNKGTGDVALYRPLGGRNVLAVRLRAGAVLGRRLSLSDPSSFIPPQERLYAGGPASVRGFQQNELGSLVYMARGSDVDTAVTVAGTPQAPDTTFAFHVRDTPNPLRVVPLGGNSLLVANFEYRVRDPFLFPDLVQYVLFVDGGDVWTRSGDRSMNIKWTPGLGIRALTPVGPIQVNAGWNRYDREQGAIYYNPDVTTLLCVSPGNGLTYRRNPTTKQLEPVTEVRCDPNFTPPPRTKFFQRLTFTFSIGSDF
jgi:outer membrane protein insertion porin family